jgi:hypothetical protein
MKMDDGLYNQFQFFYLRKNHERTKAAAKAADRKYVKRASMSVPPTRILQDDRLDEFSETEFHVCFASSQQMCPRLILFTYRTTFTFEDDLQNVFVRSQIKRTQTVSFTFSTTCHGFKGNQF